MRLPYLERWQRWIYFMFYSEQLWMHDRCLQRSLKTLQPPTNATTLVNFQNLQNPKNSLPKKALRRVILTRRYSWQVCIYQFAKQWFTDQLKVLLMWILFLEIVHQIEYGSKSILAVYHIHINSCRYCSFRWMLTLALSTICKKCLKAIWVSRKSSIVFL